MRKKNKADIEEQIQIEELLIKLCVKENEYKTKANELITDEIIKCEPFDIKALCQMYAKYNKLSQSDSDNIKIYKAGKNIIEEMLAHEVMKINGFSSVDNENITDWEYNENNDSIEKLKKLSNINYQL